MSKFTETTTISKMDTLSKKHMENGHCDILNHAEVLYSCGYNKDTYVFFPPIEVQCYPYPGGLYHCHVTNDQRRALLKYFKKLDLLHEIKGKPC